MAEGIACRLSKRDMEVQALLDRFPVSQANELRVQVLGVQLPRFLPDFTRPEQLKCTVMTPNAFDRATDPVLRILDIEQARELTEYQPESTIQARVEELAAKSNEGELTEAERAEYLGYVQANRFVAILQAQARRRVMDPG